MTQTEILVAGLGFPEGPRWHDGKLWFSDFRTKTVSTVDLDGNLNTVARVEWQPSGLGWLPDGSLLIVSMMDQRLLRLAGERPEEYADLSELASADCNDMVVAANGNAYVGNFGSPFGIPPFRLAEIVLVRPDQTAAVVATEMAFPNGSVITPDGKTLVVGETFAARLTAFDIESDGTLSNRRIWAQFDDLGVVSDRSRLADRILPDGICLDEQGGIWVASPNRHREVVRVQEGGKITDRLRLQSIPYACMLGGQDRKTLFILTSNLMSDQPVGRIETVRVPTAGTGLP